MFMLLDCCVLVGLIFLVSAVKDGEGLIRFGQVILTAPDRITKNSPFWTSNEDWLVQTAGKLQTHSISMLESWFFTTCFFKFA